MIVYVIGLQDWKWVIGIGIFIDDVLNIVVVVKVEVEEWIECILLFIFMMIMIVLFVVFVFGMFLNICECCLVDVKLKELIQWIIDI